jgi:hypothetical protein
MKFILTLTFCYLLALTNHAQISGVITDINGSPLPFASVYVQGSTIGTSSNSEGSYNLSLPTVGQYDLVFQYIGYNTLTKTIKFNGKALELDVVLKEEPLDLMAVEITADREDPAYTIIRRAQDKRKYFKDQLGDYSCDTYIKGKFTMEEMPSNFMGMNRAEMEIEGLDSAGKGIIYLSESVSTLHHSPPNDVKEIMTSSSVSGYTGIYSFNTALAMNFSIYDNNLPLMRQMVSPIAVGAMSYYKYKLEGTAFDEQGHLLNKIKVMPKTKNGPAFRGYVYITEDIWNVAKADLIISGDHLSVAALDSVRFRFISIKGVDGMWLDIQKNIWMKLKLFGFTASGGFNGTYSNYNLEPGFSNDFFKNEIIHIEKESNKKSRSYWDTIRPMPLTLEEVENYTLMDSLRLKRLEKMDSIYSTPPKIDHNILLSGYRRYFDKGSGRWYIDGPLNGSSFNTVQGFNINLNAGAHKNLDSLEKKAWKLNTSFSYGFAENRFRPFVHFEYLFHNTASTKISLDLGRKIVQVNRKNPITDMANATYSLLARKNFMKLYEMDHFGGGLQTELYNGINLTLGMGWYKQRSLRNHSDYSWYDKDKRNYSSNNPLFPEQDVDLFPKNERLSFVGMLDITFAQKYMSRGDEKIRFGSKYPQLHLGFNLRQNLNLSTNNLHLFTRISDNYSMGVLGRGNWRINAGIFVLDKSDLFTDFKHFDGNQTAFGDPATYGRAFHLLPYYDASTNDQYVQVHMEHHFDGLIMDKIPLLNKLKWKLVGGLHYLQTPDYESYFETSIGFENIGIHVFRFLRIDYAWSFHQDKRANGIIIGLNLGGLFSSQNGEQEVSLSL